MKKEKVNKEEFGVLTGVQLRTYGLMLFLLAAIVVFAFRSMPEAWVTIVRVLLSFLIIVFPLAIFDLFLDAKRLIASFLSVTGLIIFIGVIFFKLWPLKEYSDLVMSIPIIFLAVVYLQNLYGFGKDSEALQPTSLVSIDCMSELVRYCLRVKEIRNILILELWALLLGVVAHILILKYGHEEMAGLYVIIFYLVCWVLFSSFNLLGALRIVKRWNILSGHFLRLVVIVLLAVPLCITYLFVFISIAVKLAGVSY